MRATTFGPMLLLLGIAGPLCAGSSSAEMRVSVTVVPRTILIVDSEPSHVEVTQTDVARGYLELPDALIFRVRSNNPTGYLVQVAAIGGPFGRAIVTWGSSSVSIGTSEAWIAQPYRRGVTPVVASVRLDIPRGTAPGTYPWPVAVSANNL